MLHHPGVQALPAPTRAPHDALCVRALDPAFIVVDKPAGLLSVPGRTEPDCLAARVQAVYADALVVHRLDMATSGLMLLARGTAAQRVLSVAFERRRVHKRYVAVVHGRLWPERGEIDLPLITDWPQRPRQIVDHDHGRRSLTRYQVIDHDAGVGTSRVELEPVTGRSHQLRVHLQALGHPIVGDTLYGPASRPTRSSRLLLHAASLKFAHPVSGEALEWRSPVPF